MIRRLIILRHAEAINAKDIADHERSLSTNGRNEAMLIGQYIKLNGLMPDHIILSTSKRTQETGMLIKKAFKKSIAITSDHRIYEAKLNTLFYLLHETDPSFQALMLIGHNPAVAELAYSLIGDGNKKDQYRLTEQYPTGALTVIDFDVSDWLSIKPKSGFLERFVTPMELMNSVN